MDLQSLIYYQLLDYDLNLLNREFDSQIQLLMLLLKNHNMNTDI